MLPKKLIIYNIENIIFACERIITVTKKIPFEVFEVNEDAQDIVLMNFIKIGECANRILEELDSNISNLLRPAVAMRHKIAHGYDVLDTLRIFESATENVPQLTIKLKKYISKQ